MNRKAFTLIELLVVVAIIGILAAVGVVAYNGYTKSAKTNTVKLQHKEIINYIKTELMKCELGDDKIFNINPPFVNSGDILCSEVTTFTGHSGGYAIGTKFSSDYNFKNAYNSSRLAFYTTSQINQVYPCGKETSGCHVIDWGGDGAGDCCEYCTIGRYSKVCVLSYHDGDNSPTTTSIDIR